MDCYGRFCFVFIHSGCGFDLLAVTDTGVCEGSPPVLDAKKERSSSVSLASVFEVVADDLHNLNQNLQSVSTPL